MLGILIWTLLMMVRFHIKTIGENVYVLWKDDTNSGNPDPSYLTPSYASKDELFFVRSTDRGKTFTQPQILANGVDYSKVLLDGFGQYVYVTLDNFGTNQDLVFISSNDSGATFADPVNLSNNVQGDSVSDYQLLVNGNNLFVSWGSVKDSENDVFLKVSHNHGTSFSGIHTGYTNIDYWDNKSPKVAFSGPYLYAIHEIHKAAFSVSLLIHGIVNLVISLLLFCKQLGCHIVMGVHYLHVFVTKLHSKFGEGSCDGGGRFKTGGGSSVIL